MRHPKPGTLLVVAAIFAVSAAVRIAADRPVMWSWVAAFAADGTPGAEEMDTVSDAGLLAALAAIQDRERRVVDKELALEDRLRALNIAEQAVAVRLTELEAAEERLRSTIALADGAAEKDITQLTAVYENMKPKEAALLFDAMTPEFAAGFLGRMRPDAAAAILTGLEPQTAYAISVLLAGRNVGVPTE
ncbi:MAG: hypothetical protein AAFR35_13420 [Pseudomonadota bacterium]